MEVAGSPLTSLTKRTAPEQVRDMSTSKLSKREITRRPQTVRRWMKFGQVEDDPLLMDTPKFHSLRKIPQSHDQKMYERRSRETSEISARRELFANENNAGDCQVHHCDEAVVHQTDGYSLWSAVYSSQSQDTETVKPESCNIGSNHRRCASDSESAEQEDECVLLHHDSLKSGSKYDRCSGDSESGEQEEECVLLHHESLKSPRNMLPYSEWENIRDTMLSCMETNVSSTTGPSEAQDDVTAECCLLSHTPMKRHTPLKSPHTKRLRELTGTSSEYAPLETDSLPVKIEAENESGIESRDDGTECLILSIPSRRLWRQAMSSPILDHKNEQENHIALGENEESIIIGSFPVQQSRVKLESDESNDVIINDCSETDVSILDLVKYPTFRGVSSRAEASEINLSDKMTEPIKEENVVIDAQNLESHRHLIILVDRMDLIDDSAAVFRRDLQTMNGHDASPPLTSEGAAITQIDRIIEESKAAKMTENTDVDSHPPDPVDEVIDWSESGTQRDDSNVNSIGPKLDDSADGNVLISLPETSGSSSGEKTYEIGVEQNPDSGLDNKIIAPVVSENIDENTDIKHEEDSVDVETIPVDSEVVDKDTGDEEIDVVGYYNVNPAAASLDTEEPVTSENLSESTEELKMEEQEKEIERSADNSVNEDAMDLFDLGEEVAEKYAQSTETSPAASSQTAPPIKLRIRRSAEEIHSEVVSESESSLQESPAQTSSPFKKKRGRPRKKREDVDFIPTTPQKRGRKPKANESFTDGTSDIENSQNVSPQSSSRPKRAAAEKAVREVFEKSFELLEKEAFEFQPEPVFNKKAEKIPKLDKSTEATQDQPEKKKRGRKSKGKSESMEKSFEEIEKEAFEMDRNKKTEEELKPLLAIPIQEEEDGNCQYVVGDLVWSKVAGHPWWPSMVSYDPLKGKFTEVKARGVRVYHVQYFGPEPERSWVTEKSTMRYLGLDGFEEALMRERREKFKIAPKRMPDWEVAVEEADDALKMTIIERKQNLTFVYEDSKRAKAKEKEDKPAKIKAKVPHTPQKRNKCSLATVEKKLKESPSSEPPDPELTEAFDRYVSETLGPLREANPKLALDELQELLEEGWRKLRPWERNKYEEADENKRRKRARKPSSKVRENLGIDDDVTEQTVDAPEPDPADDAKQAKQRKRKRRESASPDDGPDVKKAKKDVAEKRKIETESEKQTNEDIGEKKKRQKSPLTVVYQQEISDEQALEITKLSNSGPNKKELVCVLCEKAGSGDIVTCTGQCLEAYHVTCLGVAKARENFKCDQCTSGVHNCFVCKEASTDLQKCSVVQCGKFYHEECVKTFRQTRVHKSFICPLHCCSSCFVENPSGLKAFKGRLVKCLRCPTAYHTGDFCAGAGSVPVAGFFIICPKHFRPKRTHSHHAHVNVSWCFQCSKGGMLICCEGCPGAYHADCLDEPPTARSGATWFCPDCMRGREPMYGEIVWVKLGNYRWWPAEICHPKNVPSNVQEIEHQAGEFPVRFYGSRDYYWTHRGRIFQFQEGDKGSGDCASASRSFASLFRRAVEEATGAYQLWKKTKTEKEQQASDKKPAPFKFVKSNVPVGSLAVAKPDLSEMAKCECRSDDEHPCGPESDCVNRMLWYECNPLQCPAGVKCENQRFQLRVYPEQSVFKTLKHGWGLKAMADIRKGDFVNEYVGELIDDEECKRRMKKAHEDNITNFYFLTIEKDRIIDAGPKGNYSRFMNHSCDPNCETQKWTINGEVRVGLFAKVDIYPGTELTFNYNLECLGDDKTVCECGSDNCSGFLGVRPKVDLVFRKINETPNNGQKGVKKKKRRKPKIKDDGHEDECYRCGDGGDIILCDRGNCPKAYHLSCLGLEKMPYGKWDCPWHHCDECGARAEKLCDECPNSFCSAHGDAKHVLEFPNGRTLCLVHDDLIEAYKSGKDTPLDSDTSSVNSIDAKHFALVPLKKSSPTKPRNSELGMGPDILVPKGPVKRTVNALLSARHESKFKMIEKKPKARTISKKVEVKEPAETVINKRKVGAKEIESPDDSDDDNVSGIPGYKFKTTARRAMQKIRQPRKKRMPSEQKDKPSKGVKPRKRARLGPGDGSVPDEISYSKLVIDV